MSEHEHEYKLDVKGGYYFCYCGESDLTIQDLLKKHIENQARIKTLEGLVERAEEWIENSLAVLEAWRDINIALSQLEEPE